MTNKQLIYEVKMKFKICILILMVLSSSFLYSCDNINGDNNKDIELTSYVETLETEFAYGCTTDRFNDYINNWSTENNVIYEKDNYGNIIFDMPATLGYEEVDDTIICCSYNPYDFNSDIHLISLCQYLILNNENHGPLKIILLNNEYDKNQGALNLSTKYFNENSNVIVLDSSYKTHASINTGNQTELELTIPTEKSYDLYNTAIKISISDIKAASFDEQVNRHPNPIKILGELMAYFKMKSIAYKLADINFNTDGGLYPIGCDITLLINDYSKIKFTDYLDYKISSFNKSYSDDFENANYSYKEVDLPEKAYSDKSTENIVSLLYTINNGTSMDTSDSVYGISTITGFNKTEDKFTLNVTSNTRSNEALSNLMEQIETVSTFVNAELVEKNFIKGFTGNPDSELYADMNMSNEASNNEELRTYDTVRFTANTYLKNKNKNLNQLHIFVKNDDSDYIIKCINNYLFNSNIENQSQL